MAIQRVVRLLRFHLVIEMWFNCVADKQDKGHEDRGKLGSSYPLAMSDNRNVARNEGMYSLSLFGGECLFTTYRYVTHIYLEMYWKVGGLLLGNTRWTRDSQSFYGRDPKFENVLWPDLFTVWLLTKSSPLITFVLTYSRPMWETTTKCAVIALMQL